MIQLNILSGKMAGTQWVARRFPVQIGRANDSTLRLEEAGVWERHAQLDFDPIEGFILKADTGALVTVNNQSVQNARLHNGDHVALGSVRIQFWLSEVQQRGLKLRETFVWTLVVTVMAVQILMVYWLVH